MLCAFHVDSACGDFFSQRSAFTVCQYALFDVLVLTLAFCAPIVCRHNNYFQTELVCDTRANLVCTLAHKSPTFSGPDLASCSGHRFGGAAPFDFRLEQLMVRRPVFS